MRNTILLVILIISLISCKSDSKQMNINLTGITSDEIIKGIKCKELINASMIIPNYIDSFISEIGDKYSSNFSRVILMFYSEEGEVIQSYPIYILKSDDKAIISVYLDNDQIKSKELNDYNIKDLYNYLSDIEEKEILVRRKMLVIDIEKDIIKCSLYNNIKKSDAKKIKELSFAFTEK